MSHSQLVGDNSACSLLDNFYTLFQYQLVPKKLSGIPSVSDSLDPDKAWPSVEPGPEVIKLFLCLTQLSTKFILLINSSA